MAALQLARFDPCWQDAESFGQLEANGFSDEKQQLSEAAGFLEESVEKGEAVLDDHEINCAG